MARSRNIKPALFKNEILGQADPLYTLLFQSLWMLSDREGRLEDRPLRIKAETFPYRDNINVDAMLVWLHDNNFIIRYKHQKNRYIQIVNFNKHQSPHKNEADSEIPCISDGCTTTEKIGTTTEKIGSARADSLNLIPDSLNLIPDSLKPETGKKCDDGFDVFWQEYPNKTNKQNALKAWQKLKPNESLFNQILQAVKNQKNWEQWKSGFVPHAATFLNAKRWEDEEPLRKMQSTNRPKHVSEMTEAEVRENQARVAAEAKKMLFGDDDCIEGESRRV